MRASTRKKMEVCVFERVKREIEIERRECEMRRRCVCVREREREREASMRDMMQVCVCG